jgi:EmrB/QacA subfamily drug resistance transporter
MSTNPASPPDHERPDDGARGQHGSPHHHQHQHHPMHARRWAILAIIGIAQLMVVLDATIVNIALPTAQHELGFSDDSRQWIVTAYALAFGSLLLLGGRLGDLYGRKRVFITGLSGFAIASAIGGAAQSVEMLIAARALQGVFGALLAPAALSLLTTTFVDPDERAKAFGVFGAIAGGGGAIGLLLGGALTEYLSWRWCLYVNLAFAAIAIIGGARLLVDRERDAARGIDLPGVATSTVGLFLIVFGLAKAETAGWGAAITIAPLVIGTAVLAVFVVLQQRSSDPLLPLSVVRDRLRGGSFLAVGISGAGIFAVFLFLTYYLQQSLQMSPITSGVAFLPMIVTLVICASTATAVIAPRIGPRALVTLGMLIGAGGMFLLAQLDTSSTYASDVLPALIAMGAGMGLIFAPSMSGATLGVDAGHAGVASATVNTSQQIGGSIGTALLSSLAATSVSDSVSAALASHPELAGKPTQAILAAAQIDGYTTAFSWAAGIFLIGAIITAVVMPGGVPEVDPDAGPVFAH